MARGGEVEWKGTGKGPFLANGADTLRVCRAKDRFTRGIWTAGTPNEDDLLPMEGTLGPSLDQRSPAEKGSERRQQLTPVQCKGESVDHLYFSCAFTQSLLSQVLLAAGGLVNLTTTESFTSLADKLNTITNGSPPWGLNWNIIGALSWLIWRERNSRQKSNKFSQDLIR